MIELSIILPVHNEELNIRRTLSDIETAMKPLRIRYELICVENASTDNTLKVLVELAKKNSHIHVIISPKGWGNAVRAGIKKARGVYSCFMVSDGQVPATSVIKIYMAIKRTNAPLVKIWRTQRENVSRLFISRFYNLLAFALFHFKTLDINATPKILKTKTLRDARLQSRNIALDLELLIWLHKHNMSWKEFPVAGRKRAAGSSTTKLSAVIEMFRAMIDLYTKNA